MADPNSYRINKKTLDEAQVIIDSGIFGDISKMINYCMVFYLDHIEKYGIKSIKHIPRDDTAAKVCRLNETVLQRLADTGFVTKKEVPEYALRFYLDWRSSGD